MAIQEITSITVTPNPAVIACDGKKFEFQVEMKGKAEASGGEGTLDAYDKNQEQRDPKGKQEKDKDTGDPLYKGVDNTQKTPKIEPKEVKNGEFTKISTFDLICEAKGNECTIKGLSGSKSKARIFVRMKFKDPKGKWLAKDSNPVEVECKKGS